MIFTAIGVGIYSTVIILVVAPIVRYLLLRCSSSCTVELDAKTLFITAHPDDECMFFAPSVLALTAHNRKNAFLLCLSEGKCRRQELISNVLVWHISISLINLFSPVYLLRA